MTLKSGAAGMLSDPESPFCLFELEPVFDQAWAQLLFDNYHSCPTTILCYPLIVSSRSLWRNTSRPAAGSRLGDAGATACKYRLAPFSGGMMGYDITQQTQSPALVQWENLSSGGERDYGVCTERRSGKGAG